MAANGTATAGKAGTTTTANRPKGATTSAMTPRQREATLNRLLGQYHRQLEQANGTWAKIAALRAEAAASAGG